MPEQEKKFLKEKLKEVTPGDLQSPSKTLSKLDLLSDDSPVKKFRKRLSELIEQKPEVDEAYTYLTLEESS